MEEVAPGARHAVQVEMSGSGRIVEGRGTTGGGAVVGAAALDMAMAAGSLFAVPELRLMGAVGWDDPDGAAAGRRAGPAAVAAPVSSAAGPSGDEFPVAVPLSGRFSSSGCFDEDASVPAAPAVASMMPTKRRIYQQDGNMSRGGGSGLSSPISTDRTDPSSGRRMSSAVAHFLREQASRARHIYTTNGEIGTRRVLKSFRRPHLSQARFVDEIATFIKIRSKRQTAKS